MVQRAAAGRCLCHTLTEFWMVKVCGGLLDVSHFLVCHMCFLSSQRYLNWTHIIKPSQAAGEMRAHSPLSLHSAPLCAVESQSVQHEHTLFCLMRGDRVTWTTAHFMRKSPKTITSWPAVISTAGTKTCCCSSKELEGGEIRLQA